MTSVPGSPLTAMQRKVLQFLADFKRENESMPTRADIARHFEHRSSNAADEHLQALERKGMVSRVAGKARGLRLTFLGIAELGLQNPAGSPFPAPAPPSMLALPVYDVARPAQFFARTGR